MKTSSFDPNDILIEFAKLNKQADNMSSVLTPDRQDKIVNTVVQKLTSSAADGEEWDEVEKAFKKLLKDVSDKKLVEIQEYVAAELEARDTDVEEVEEEEEEKENDMDDMLSYTLASLQQLAQTHAANGDIVGAYKIERSIQNLKK